MTSDEQWFLKTLLAKQRRTILELETTLVNHLAKPELPEADRARMVKLLTATSGMMNAMAPFDYS